MLRIRLHSLLTLLTSCGFVLVTFFDNHFPKDLSELGGPSHIQRTSSLIVDGLIRFFLYLRKFYLHCSIGRVGYFLYRAVLHSSVTVSSAPAAVHTGWVKWLVLCVAT